MANKKIALAGGCFWGVEELFRALHGVLDTEVGYCGGQTPNATYEMVKTGKTGHAEAIEITYDPKQIELSHLLEFFFRMHDPTTKNRQGNDVGSQYRSAIFTSDPDEIKVAKLAIDTAQKKWPSPIVTLIEPNSIFYSAEAYHQDYLQKNPNGYTCHFIRK